MVSATITATGVSDIFTQDVEDFAEEKNLNSEKFGKSVNKNKTESKKQPTKKEITEAVSKLSENAKFYFKDVMGWNNAREVYEYLVERKFDYETIEKEIKNDN